MEEEKMEAQKCKKAHSRSPIHRIMPVMDSIKEKIGNEQVVRKRAMQVEKECFILLQHAVNHSWK
jgi:hypothetical protein